MYRKIPLLIIALSIFILSVGANAQSVSPNPNTPPNPDANISFPPPVYFMRGEMQIYGTANLPNMTSYFLEYRPLIVSPSPDIVLPEIPWGPVSLPSNVPIQDGLLGIWNTFTVADGLYELRLTINIPNQEPFHALVSPLRVENDPSDYALRNIQLFLPPDNFDIVRDPVSTPDVSGPGPVSTGVPTGPQVTSNTDANVRSGDSTAYPVVGVLRNGTSAPILGLSNTGSGWYYIELSSGVRGFIAPSVVNVTGDTSNLQRFAPPPPPPTATPTRTPTPAATSTATGGVDLAMAYPSLSPSSPACGVSFNVSVNITNIGTATATGPFNVVIQNYNKNTGVVTNIYTSSIHSLAPGGNFVVQTSPAFIANANHEIRVYIDPTNVTPDINRANNYIAVGYNC